MTFSVSNKQQGVGTYTWGYKVKEISSFVELLDSGFSVWKYKQGYRNGENIEGFLDGGYVDIDAEHEPFFDDSLIDLCKKEGWGLARSQSLKRGKYRIIYKRCITIEGEDEEYFLKGWGFNDIRINKENIYDYGRVALATEMDYFIEKLKNWGRGNVDNIDKTALGRAMHSKKVGDILVEPRDIIVLPWVEYDFNNIEYSSVSKVYCRDAANVGRMGHFKVRTYNNKETIEMVSGNVIKVGSQYMGLGEAIRSGKHLSDPIEGINNKYRCEDDDAYMPLKARKDGDTLILFSVGNHNRNGENTGNTGNFYKSLIWVKFTEAQTEAEIEEKYKSVISIDGLDYLIDENSKLFKKVEK